LDQALKLLTDKTALTEEYKSTVDKLIAKLKTAAENWQPSKIPYLEPLDDSVKAQRKGNLIYLVEDDELLSEDLSTQLKHSGFEVKILPSLTSFTSELSKDHPSAIIMDVMFKDGEQAGIESISGLNKEIKNLPPVIFISTRRDIQTRLAAARAGGRRYFSKPVDVNQLSHTLDGLLNRVKTKPFRILFVDDYTSLVSFYDTIVSDA